jgi:hypothetical protein
VLAGIVGAALLVLTLGSISASAAAPYGCGAPGAYCGVPYAGYAGYAGYGAMTTYFDPRYCGNGLIAIVPEPSNGAPINICASTGQRVFPAYPDYGAYPGYPGYPGYAPGGVPVNYLPYGYNPYVYR